MNIPKKKIFQKLSPTFMQRTNLVLSGYTARNWRQKKRWQMHLFVSFFFFFLFTEAFYATKSTTEYFQKILERPPKKQRLLSRCIFTLRFNSVSLLLWMSEDSNLPGVKVFSLAPVQPRTCLNRCPSQTVQRNTMECFQP